MTIDTGHKWFGQRILLESTGDPETDKALASTFTSEWDDSGPLEISRADCQMMLAWVQRKGVNKPPQTRAEGRLF